MTEVMKFRFQTDNFPHGCLLVTVQTRRQIAHFFEVRGFLCVKRFIKMNLLQGDSESGISTRKQGRGEGIILEKMFLKNLTLKIPDAVFLLYKLRKIGC